MKRGPTLAESRALKLIAVGGGMMVTYRNGAAEYATSTGIPINANVAKRIIAERQVLPERDGLFDFTPQRYRCRKPGDEP